MTCGCQGFSSLPFSTEFVVPYAPNHPSSQRHYTKGPAISDVRAKLAAGQESGNVNDGHVLEALRTLLFTSSQFSYGVRGASFSAEDLRQIDLRGRDVVSIHCSMFVMNTPVSVRFECMQKRTRVVFVQNGRVTSSSCS